MTETHQADVGFIYFSANEDFADVAQHHHERCSGAHIEDGRHGTADLDITGKNHTFNRRTDRGIVQFFLRPLHRGLRLRNRGLRLGDARLRDGQLGLRGPLPVFGNVERHPGIIVFLLRDQAVLEQLFGPVEVPFVERDIDALGFNFVLFEFGLSRLGIGLGPQQCGASFAQPGGEIVLIQFDKDLTFVNQITGLDFDFLDDAVGLRLDFDLGDGLDSADRHYGPGDIRPFNRSQARWINVHCRTRQNGHAVNTGGCQHDYR